MFSVVRVDTREIGGGWGEVGNVYLNLCQIWVIVHTGVSWPVNVLLS